MNPRYRRLVVILALGVSIVWGVYNSPSGSKEKADSQRPATIKPISAQELEFSREGLINIEKMELTAWGKDPFRRKHRKKHVSLRPKLPKWTLSGVLFNSAEPMAVINNRSVKVGNVIDKARVVDIQKKSVVLEYSGRQFTIKVTTL